MKNNFLSCATLLLATCLSFSNASYNMAYAKITETTKVENVDTDSDTDTKLNDITGGSTVTEEIDYNTHPATSNTIYKESITTNTKSVDKKTNVKDHHTLQIQITTPKGSYGDKVVSAFADEVRKISGNNLKFEIHYGASLGCKPEDMLDQMESGGIADIIWTSSPYCAKLKSLEATMQPGVIAYDATDLNGIVSLYYDSIKNSKEFHNMKVILLHGETGTTLHMKGVKPGQSIEDLKNLGNGMVRISSKAMTNLFAGELGMNPMFLTAKDLYEKLRYHGMSVAMAPYELLKTMHADEFLTDHLVNPMYSTVFVLAMNKDSYDKLPKNLKHAIDSVSRDLKFGYKLGEMINQAEEEAICALRIDGNHNFYKIDEAGMFVKLDLPKLDPKKVAQYKTNLQKANAGNKSALKITNSLRKEFLAEIKAERKNQIKMILEGDSYLSSYFDRAIAKWINNDPQRLNEYETLKGMLKSYK